jgi:hypothetical protein
VAEQDGIDICFVCQKPLVPGKGRYRTEKGDAHIECYGRRQKKTGGVDPREPKEK